MLWWSDPNPIDSKKKKSLPGFGTVFSYLTTPNERKQNKYRTKPMLDLLKKLDKESAKKAERENVGFGELRDLLLRIDPLNVDHVKKVNAAEAEFWKRSHGTRVDWSDQILGFDCGGQQHVLEVAFPCGTLEEKVKILCRPRTLVFLILLHFEKIYFSCAIYAK